MERKNTTGWSFDGGLVGRDDGLAEPEEMEVPRYDTDRTVALYSAALDLAERRAAGDFSAETGYLPVLAQPEDV